MSTGYQTPRPHRGSRRPASKGPTSHGLPRTGRVLIDLTESELADTYELPGAVLLLDEDMVEILAEQVDEFTCGSCFLVRHRSQLAEEKHGVKFCHDCEG